MNWISWALLSAVFAALTAIFAKAGVARIDSDLATLVRTAVILLLLGPFVFLAGKWTNPLALPPRGLAFLVLSAVATGASWVCYFRALQSGPVAQVASLDKLSVVLVALFAVVFLSERQSALGWLGILLVGAGAAVIAFASTRGSA
jgi:transporter family protein